MFVYKALAELYLFGDTDVEVERIEEHVKEIRTVDEETGESGLQREFLVHETFLARFESFPA